MQVRRTGGDDFPRHLKAMLAGPPKSGKTTFLGSVPNIIVADTEPDANNLMSIAHLNVPYVTVDTMQDLRDLILYLGNDTMRGQLAQHLGMEKIEAFAIDTIDTLQKIMKKERLQENRTTQWTRDDWAWIREEMGAIIRSCTRLPMHVFFCVHTKSKELGRGDDTRAIVLPALQGGIDEEIAGMVGYSLGTYRKEETGPDGKPFTKYWIRAEGDETYEFLGNRGAGQLPAQIEPRFDVLLNTAMRAWQVASQHQSQLVEMQSAQAALAQQQPQGQLPMGQQGPPPQQYAQPQQAPQQGPPPQHMPGQTPGPEHTQGQPQAQPGNFQPQGPEAPQQQVPSPDRPADDAPMNVAAMGHVKKVYDELRLAFPEEAVGQLNLGQARGIVKMYQALKADETQGSLAEGRTVLAEMQDYLGGSNLLAAEPYQEPEQAKQVEPKIDGTIAEVKAFTQDGASLPHVQQAYDRESQQTSPRKSLIDWLTSKGAQTQQPTQQPQQPAPQQVGQTSAQQPAPQGFAPQQQVAPQQQPAPPAPQQEQTAVQTAPPAPATEAPREAQASAVTQPPTQVDAGVSEEQGVANAAQGLGGTVLSTEITESSVCESCGNRIDDMDIARLAVGRFKSLLCTQHYIARTRQPS